MTSSARRLLLSAFAALALVFSAPAHAAGILDVKDTDLVIGKPTAPVTIVEYASLTCPHCAHFYNEILPELYKNYIETGKVKFVARDYPLNEPALKAAMLVRCAPADKKQAFLKVLYGSQEKWAFDPAYEKLLATIAALGGISQAKFDACMKNTNLEMAIVKERQEAQEQLKLEATPTFYIGTQQVVGPKDIKDLTNVIDPMLGGKK